jgi:hypothetical protein
MQTFEFNKTLFIRKKNTISSSRHPCKKHFVQSKHTSLKNLEECDGIYAKACSEVYHLICVQKHVLKLSTLFYILGEIINTKMEKHIRLCCTLLLPQLGIATRDLIFGMLWFGLSLHKDTHLQVSINGKQVAYSFVGVASNFISWC